MTVSRLTRITPVEALGRTPADGLIAFADTVDGETIYTVCRPVRGGYALEVERLGSQQEIQDIYGDVPIFQGWTE